MLNLQYFPSKDKIQEAYALDPYDKITLEGLQIKNMFVSKNIENSDHTSKLEKYFKPLFYQPSVFFSLIFSRR